MNIEGVSGFRGKLPGKTITVMAGVHGNEICGPRAFEILLPKLKIDRGVVNFVIGNPRAVEKNVRFTEMNLNRAFRPDELLTDAEKNSYERSRAVELMPILEASGAFLDIHSSSSGQSIPFAICEAQSFSVVRRLPISIRSSGWGIIEPGATDEFVNSRGGLGICVECGHHLDQSSVKKAIDVIRSFLIVTGAISGEIPPENPNQREVHAHTIYLAKISYKPVRIFADFEPIEKGELIGYDGDEEVFAQEDGVIVFGAKEKSKPGEEAFILGRENVL